MLAHMDKIARKKRGGIIFGGLITSIALALGLEKEVVQLILIDMCLSQNLVELKIRNEYYLMINNEVIKNIVLLNLTPTNVHVNKIRLYLIETLTGTKARYTIPPSYMPSSFAGYAYHHCNNIEYELNILRHEVSALGLEFQERNTREAEQAPQNCLRDDMIEDMWFRMVYKGMRPIKLLLTPMIDSGSSFLSCTFVNTLRIMFNSSAGEEFPHFLRLNLLTFFVKFIYILD